MKRFIYLVVIFVFSTLFTLQAQQKMMTATDASRLNPALFPKRVPQLQWMGKTDNYVFARKDTFYKKDAARGKAGELFDKTTLNTDLLQAGMDTIKRLPRFTFFSEHKTRFSRDDGFYIYDFQQHIIKKVNQVPDTAKNVSFDAKTNLAAFTLKNNLYLAQDGKVIPVTHDKNPDYVNGQIVSRNEFGIDKGIFWSPNGDKLAFYHKDQSRVFNYPLVDINHRIAEVKNIKYPMAGTPSEYVSLGVYNLKTGKTIFLKTNPKSEQYLTAVTWGPAGKYIYIAVLNRGQNHMWMNKYDASTGTLVKTLFEETNPKYVEPLFPLYFNPFNPDEFIWNSRRDGWNHLYLYNTDGKLLKQLTKGKWEVTHVLGYFMKNKVYFVATKESPLQQNLYSVNMRNGKVVRLSPDHGTHRAMVSKDGRYLLDVFSSTDVSRDYKLLNYRGKVVRIIQQDKDPLAGYQLGKMSIFTLKSKIDGANLYYRMIKPVNFDSTKKYPVIVYVYGGPHVQLITDTWLGGAGFMLNYLAENGYLIFTLDNHGSENRGRDFEQVIFRHLGTNEIKDQMTGVNYLKSLPYVDSTRLGVDGWSFGGFMTTSLMLREPGVFKVAVAGGPVIDWKYYEVMYGERYMDTPQENPEGYKEASLLNYVHNLQGHLLLIHGTMDPVVVWQNSLLFLQKAIHEDKLIDYFVYPGHEHGVTGRDRLQLTRKIKSYFDDWL
ncbi:MAG: prolyl tripeptidyl peptidase [bacterium]|nr:MAG: prolyl tripeptidyl peptidase [bacterium]